jgi:hypothetical protein
MSRSNIRTVVVGTAPKFHCAVSPIPTPSWLRSVLWSEEAGDLDYSGQVVRSLLDAFDDPVRECIALMEMSEEKAADAAYRRAELDQMTAPA